MRGCRSLAGPLGLALVLSFGLGACSATDGDTAPSPDASATSADPAAPTTPDAPAAVTDVATDLEAPWSIVFVGTAPSVSALVSERDSGRILEITQGAQPAPRVVGTVADVAHGGEGGLLGLAFDGDRGLYAYSTGSAGNRVERYELEGAAGSFALGARSVVIDGLPRAGNHNGGRIAFGPDGMLYVAVGDAGDRALAQDPDARNGKILRLRPDGGIPDDNPTAGSPVYSLGHRNVQGIAWSADGRMFASEFGQNTWDELNEILPGGNYGWPVVEGTGGADQGFVDPLLTWPTSDASPSGIAITDDVIVMANLRGERLRTVPIADPAAAVEHFAGELGRLRDVAVAPDGSIWLLTNNTDGRGTPRPGDDRIVRVPLALLE